VYLRGFLSSFFHSSFIKLFSPNRRFGKGEQSESRTRLLMALRTKKLVDNDCANSGYDSKDPGCKGTRVDCSGDHPLFDCKNDKNKVMCGDGAGFNCGVNTSQLLFGDDGTIESYQVLNFKCDEKGLCGCANAGLLP